MVRNTISLISPSAFINPSKSDPVELVNARSLGTKDKPLKLKQDGEEVDSANGADDVPSFLQKMTSWRWFTAILTSMGVVFIILLRNCMSMALVCMTGGRRGGSGNWTQDGNLSFPVTFNETFFMPRGEFDWDSETQGIILSAAFYSSFIAPAISGFVARRFGAKIVVGVSVSASAVATLLTPLGARAHVNFLIGLRVFLGFFSGTIFPASLELWSHWAPGPERVQLVSSTYTGINVGSLAASLLSGFICTIPHDNGWPYVFYVFGGLSAIWCVVWFLCIHDTPETHPWISQEEAQYIAKHTMKKEDPQESSRPPFLQMFLSGPVWAFIIVQTCHMWCSSIFFAYLPKYMSDVLHFSIEQNAIISSAPFATRFVGVMAWGYLSDLLLRKSSISVTWIRKIVQSSGFLVCGVFTVGIGMVNDQQREIAVALFLLAMFCQSSSMSSSSVTPLDIAPRYAGIITGAYMVIGSFMSMFGPMAAAYLTPNGTLEEWRIVFFIIAGVYVVGVTAFVFLGSGELQPWAVPEEQSSSEATTDPELGDNKSDITCDESPTCGRNQENKVGEHECQLNYTKNGHVNAAFEFDKTGQESQLAIIHESDEDKLSTKLTSSSTKL
ncbi:uncharacterized transporter slc-17.2-like [Haliotis cracherodii]|uniref:uncharacterized transporter slc-17.2-like n=1 Tax=Haliotis cracherodii TaxID=6455 RepID=UPI0039ED7D3D